jgi:selenide,water dikinase
VYALDETTALVQTVDFFTPIVDDPYDYGAIAAANALSDVYAMGATPITALAIAALPRTGLDIEDVRAIFRGGLDAMQSAGVSVLGGHTVQDQEVKFGYAVTGVVTPGRHWANAGARVGDALLLTKPIGTGVVSTAIKNDLAPPDAIAAAVASMRAMNAAAATVFRETPAGTVGGCTDVTGFSLLGHGCEMAQASGVRLHIASDQVPLLPGALALAASCRPGGTAANLAHFAPFVRLSREIDPDLLALLYDPQTSGGLLVTVSEGAAPGLLSSLWDAGVTAAIVGRAGPVGEEGPGIDVW